MARKNPHPRPLSQGERGEETSPATGDAADPAQQDLLRQIPSVSSLLSMPAVDELLRRHPRSLVTAAIREVLDETRSRMKTGGRGGLDPQDLTGPIAARIAALARPTPGRAINATGVILHTGLGRAPLADAARRAIADDLAGYNVLEIDRETGRRGRREDGVVRLLKLVTGAPAATVVNNNAAATLLALAALARGKEVVVARGQLVEIGGSFRIPEVMAESGARLVEVGATNRVHRRDYERAIGPETALLLKVHPSNFRVMGFTKEVPIGELVEIGRARGVGVMDDLGSGNLLPLAPYGLPDEPTVSRSIEAGARVVTFSGDKLLGGPQAGLICGTEEAVARIRAHALFRAMRPGKLVIAALDATLRLYLDPERALHEVPTLHLLVAPVAAVRERATRLAAALEADLATPWRVRVVRTRARTGSGALPVQDIPSAALALAGGPLDALARRLRMGEPPVFPRIARERLLLDLRTVFPAEDPVLLDRLRAALGG